MRFAVVYEPGDRNWCAFVPDLPGCVSTGATREMVEANIREAIALHLNGMREDGDAPPALLCDVGYVDVTEAEIYDGIRDITPAEAEAFLLELEADDHKSERDAA